MSTLTTTDYPATIREVAYSQKKRGAVKLAADMIEVLEADGWDYTGAILEAGMKTDVYIKQMKTRLQ